MSDNPGYYAEWYGSEPTAENPFANPALRLTPNNEMHAFLAAGGRLTDYLKMKEVQKCL